MGLSDIDANSVLRAIKEYDKLGQKAFLERYGFGTARSYILEHDGKPYDSKAIIGRAHSFARRDLGLLPASDFSGGVNVRKLLNSLGFPKVGPSEAKTSKRLEVGEIYTRDHLREMFEIADATLNTGVFRPKDTRSIWLFVTENKTSDRTQYRDRLVGDTLHWQGQTSGRTDALVIGHAAAGLELLLFYRKRKYEFEGAGFRFEGRFDYVSHSGRSPTSFVLERSTDRRREVIAPDTADPSDFEPDGIEDARSRIARTIAERRGQQAFRDKLLKAYGRRCAISGCPVVDVLEAAHIVPYLGDATNVLSNGILLRADLHTLFDCHLIWIDATTMTVQVDEALARTGYAKLHGRKLRLPQGRRERPSLKALERHSRAIGK